MCRPMARTFLLRGPQGPHGMRQIIAHDMADYRSKCQQLTAEKFEDGSYWDPAEGTIEEIALTRPVDDQFPGHIEPIELDDIPYLKRVH